MNTPISYYILLPGDSLDNLMYETNLLGESDLNGSFWPGQGLQALMNISNTNPDLLVDIKILTDKNKTITVENFLKDLQKLKIKKLE